MEIRRVMVVDDEPDIQVVAEMSLSIVGGWSVQVVSTGEDALREEEGGPPDIILLDMMMPGMDGLTTLARLREQEETSRIPVILMTAKAQPYQIETYMREGADGVIPKPFDPMELPAKLREIAASLP